MKYYIDGKKYRVKPEEAYIRVNGWCFDEEGLDYELKAMVDGKRCEIVQKQIARSDVQKKYEVAKELGIYDKVLEKGWGSLTAEETGRVGGMLRKRKNSGERVLS